MKQTAILDKTEKYRYLLTREWDEGKGKVLFIMLNPSTADAANDDPTIRRCINFAKDWGYGGIEVVNLFAFRATQPQDLKKETEPVGQENDSHILAAAKRAEKSLIILAWGNHGSYLDRDKDVLALVADYQPQCLEKTKAGQPAHPLVVAKACVPFIYNA